MGNNAELQCPRCGSKSLEHKDGLTYQCSFCDFEFEAKIEDMDKPSRLKLAADLKVELKDLYSSKVQPNAEMKKLITKRDVTAVDITGWVLLVVFIVAGLGLFMLFWPLIIIGPVAGVACFVASRIVKKVAYKKYQPQVAVYAKQVNEIETKIAQYSKLITALESQR